MEIPPAARSRASGVRLNRRRAEAAAAEAPAAAPLNLRWGDDDNDSDAGSGARRLNLRWVDDEKAGEEEDPADLSGFSTDSSSSSCPSSGAGDDNDDADENCGGAPPPSTESSAAFAYANWRTAAKRGRGRYNTFSGRRSVGRTPLATMLEQGSAAAPAPLVSSRTDVLAPRARLKKRITVELSARALLQTLEGAGHTQSCRRLPAAGRLPAAARFGTDVNLAARAAPADRELAPRPMVASASTVSLEAAPQRRSRRRSRRRTLSGEDGGEAGGGGGGGGDGGGDGGDALRRRRERIRKRRSRGQTLKTEETLGAARRGVFIPPAANVGSVVGERASTDDTHTPEFWARVKDRVQVARPSRQSMPANHRIVRVPLPRSASSASAVGSAAAVQFTTAAAADDAAPVPGIRFVPFAEGEAPVAPARVRFVRVQRPAAEAGGELAVPEAGAGHARKPSFSYRPVSGADAVAPTPVRVAVHSSETIDNLVTADNSGGAGDKAAPAKEDKGAASSYRPGLLLIPAGGLGAVGGDGEVALTPMSVPTTPRGGASAAAGGDCSSAGCDTDTETDTDTEADEDPSAADPALVSVRVEPVVAAPATARLPPSASSDKYAQLKSPPMSPRDGAAATAVELAPVGASAAPAAAAAAAAGDGGVLQPPAELLGDDDKPCCRVM